MFLTLQVPFTNRRPTIRVICRAQDIPAGGQEISDYLALWFRGRVEGPIQSAVDRSDSNYCRVLIVVISTPWHPDGDGRPLIDDCEDPLRAELLTALRNRISIIPVLVRGAERISRVDLPEELGNFSRLKPVIATDDEWDTALAELAARVRDAVDPARPGILLLNLLLLLLLAAWSGSWLSQATTFGEAIQAQWSLPIFGQVVLATWGVFMQLFPYKWNPESVRRPLSRIWLSASLGSVLAGLWVYFATTPVFAFRNTGRESVRVTIYNSVGAVNLWTRFGVQMVSSNAVMRVRFPLWNSVFGHSVSGDSVDFADTCLDHSGSVIPFGLSDQHGNARYPLQAGCAKPRLAVPILVSRSESDSSEFVYPTEADITLKPIVIEPSKQAREFMDSRTPLYRDPNNGDRLRLQIFENAGATSALAEATFPFAGKPVGVTTELPPGTNALYMTNPPPVCDERAISSKMPVYGFVQAGRPLLVLPRKPYVLKYKILYVPQPEWSGPRQDKMSDLQSKSPETQQYCLDFGVSSK